MSKSEFKLSKKKLIKACDDNKNNNRSHSIDRKSYEQDMSEEEEDEQFPIEKIITRRISKSNGKLEYFIKWQGYSPNESTWETMKNLIEDYCFEKLFDYENLSLDKKIELLKEYKYLKKLKRITEESLRNSEECAELKFFKDNYQDFNPQLKECLDKWDYGNLNDDIIDYIIPYQRTKKEGMIFRCFWKKREKEDKPRKSRYYPYSVILNVDKENFHKAFYYFDK